MIFCVLRWTWSFVFIFIFVFVLVCIYVLCFCAATDFSVNKDLYNNIYIYIFVHRKFGSDTETQQRKLYTNKVQYKIQRSTIKSITVVNTWYWSINKISYIIIFVYQA